MKRRAAAERSGVRISAASAAGLRAALDSAQLKFRGTLQPPTSAGENFHFATAARTDRVSAGWVLFTTENVLMSATPSVSTSTRIRTSALPSLYAASGRRFGKGAGCMAMAAGTRSTPISESATARLTHSLHVTTGSGGASRTGVAD